MAPNNQKTMVGITPTQVSVINASEILKADDAYVNRVVTALRKQVENDFAPAWGITAELDFIDNGQACSRADEMYENCPQAAEHWWLVLLDSSDVAGVTGYHDVTLSGRPMAKVFVGTDFRYGREWTISASHELLEMLVDPGMNLTALNPADEDAVAGRLYAYEVCDPCDAEEYPIDEIRVSNFVHPAWFEWFQKDQKDIQFDQLKSASKPFDVRPGGFISVLDMPHGIGWYQLYGDATPKVGVPVYNTATDYRRRPLVGSRRERRILGRWWPRGGGIG